MKPGNIFANKITTVFIVTALMLALTSCSTNFEEVKLEVGEIKTIDFNRYDKIVYADLLVESNPEGFNPVKELDDFFIGDLSNALGKKIAPLDITFTGIDTDTQTDTEDNAQLEKIKEHLKGSPNSLLITGKLSFDIKTRTKVEEIKGETGKKEKTFVKVQHWGLTMKIRVIEVDTGRELFNKSYSEKTSSADVTNPKYNFDDLFFKMNNNFTRELINKKSTQRRYLLID